MQVQVQVQVQVQEPVHVEELVRPVGVEHPHGQLQDLVAHRRLLQNILHVDVASEGKKSNVSL